MKKLEISQMENLNGGRNDVACGFAGLTFVTTMVGGILGGGLGLIGLPAATYAVLDKCGLL